MAVAQAQADHSFYWRKLHSLTGIIPIGAFLAEHFWSNSYALVSKAAYNRQSEELQGIPWRIFVEALVIWIPILYHGGYGVYVWLKGEANATQYPWLGNWAYTFQRYTGLVAFAFIGWHVWTERFLTHGRSTFADLEHAFANPWYLGFYVVGVVAASLHLGVGVWNFLYKWGITATARAQRSAGYLGALVAIVFTVVGLLIVISIRLNIHPFSGYVE